MKLDCRLKFIQIIILLSLISVVGCHENNNSIKQDEEALINGVSKAICYSGFREGQHPDRGDGAVNPSYEETLEDLQILARNSNFSLIRLYDSGENSQLILRVIDENAIDIKVMLGVWPTLLP